MKRPTCRPRVEELEPRSTPSGMGQGIQTLPGVLLIFRAVTHPPVTGLLTGTYTTLFHIPESGTPYTFNGSGVLAGLGKVSANGSVQGVGMVSSGHASGTLTLSNHRGTVTFALTGPAQAGFAPLPSRFTSTITGSTGWYKNLRGTGTATLHLEPILLRAIACFPRPKGCPNMGGFKLKLS